ncbi:hypothetical protein ACF0H5_014086 [Mactra antiquata]
MFPRVTLLYRLLAVCVSVTIIMILLQSVDDRINHKPLTYLPAYVKHSMREIDSYGDQGIGNYSNATAQVTSLTTMHPPVNPHNFNFVVNPTTFCSSTRPEYVVYVHSAPKNHKKRQMVRQTWGAKSVCNKYNMRVVFIMGLVSDQKVMNTVKLESNTYGDLVIEDFDDSYRNLTYKAIAGLKWVSKYCSDVKYVIKSDDDILIDMHALMDQLNSTEVKSYGTRNVIMCNQWLRMKVIRDKSSKWYISKEEFPDDFFPPYCSGSVFIMTSDVVQRMYWASLQTKFFWVDDFYITGLLVKRIGIEHKRLNENYMLNARAAMEKFNGDVKHELRFFHVRKLVDVYKMWNTLEKNQNTSCSDCYTWTPPKFVNSTS